MAFSDPQHNIKQFVLGESWHVADFGAGAGAYTFSAAEAVGPEGKVYAIDVQKELLTKIKNEARSRGLLNVEILWGDIEEQGGSKLGDQSMDAAIVSNVLFQAEDRSGPVSEVKRVLKPGGKVLVIDWTDSWGGLGPHPDHVVTKETAQKLFEDAGFTHLQDIDAGEHHYGLVLKKN